EQKLKDYDRSDANWQVLVAKMSLKRERRVEQIAAVQKIEYLPNRDGVNCDSAGERVRAMLRLYPEESQQRKCEQSYPNEDNAPDSKTGQDRSVGRAWRSFHHIQLVRFERDHEPKRNGGHHVDP